jgi:hypothetical protein
MRLRFTIRDLLWLLALVAVCLGWLVDSRGRIRQHEADEQHFSQTDMEIKRMQSNVNELLRRVGGPLGPRGGPPPTTR